MTSPLQRLVDALACGLRTSGRTTVEIMTAEATYEVPNGRLVLVLHESDDDGEDHESTRFVTSVSGLAMLVDVAARGATAKVLGDAVRLEAP